MLSYPVFRRPHQFAPVGDTCSVTVDPLVCSTTGAQKGHVLLCTCITHVAGTGASDGSVYQTLIITVFTCISASVPPPLAAIISQQAEDAVSIVSFLPDHCYLESRVG